MKIIKSDRFNKWYSNLELSQRTLVDVRLTRILLDNHFGLIKKIGMIFELKFYSGLRVYFAKDDHDLILLLNGGGKNTKRDQSKDIKEALVIFEEYLNGK